LSDHQEQIDELSVKLEEIEAAAGPLMETYASGVRALWEAVAEKLKDRMPDLNEYLIPEADEASEIGDGLYNSQRDYLEQLEAYKAFRGK
jgi:hypothetical protein